MTTFTTPINIQQALDDWLAGNAAAQQYVTKLWYLPAGQPAPPDVTHRIAVTSNVSADRALTIGLVVKPQYAVMLDALLALVATQPPGVTS
jgi:hypothetical protein